MTPPAAHPLVAARRPGARAGPPGPPSRHRRRASPPSATADVRQQSLATAPGHGRRCARRRVPRPEQAPRPAAPPATATRATGPQAGPGEAPRRSPSAAVPARQPAKPAGEVPAAEGTAAEAAQAPKSPQPESAAAAKDHTRAEAVAQGADVQDAGAQDTVAGSHGRAQMTGRSSPDYADPRRGRRMAGGARRRAGDARPQLRNRSLVCAQKAPTRAEVRAPGGQASRPPVVARAPRPRTAASACSATERSWGRRSAARCGSRCSPGRQYLFSVRPVNAAGSVSNCVGRADRRRCAGIRRSRCGTSSVKRVRKLRATLSWAKVRRGDGRLAGYRVYRDGVVYRQVKPRRRSIRVRGDAGDAHVPRDRGGHARAPWAARAARCACASGTRAAERARPAARSGACRTRASSSAGAPARKRSSPIAGYRIFRNGVPVGQVTRTDRRPSATSRRPPDTGSRSRRSTAGVT